MGRELGHPGWSLDGPTAIPAQRLAPRDLTNLLAALAPWRRPALGVGLVEGAAEIDVAAPFEVYASSYAARTVPIAAGRTVMTRHGLRLVTAPADAAAPRVDRLIVPGVHRADQVDPGLAGGRPGVASTSNSRRQTASSASTRCCATSPPTPTGPPPASPPNPSNTPPATSG